MFVILLGPPGAGKGTQADLLAEQLEVPKISTGDLFREEIARGTPTGVTAASYINPGRLVPDELTMEVLRARLARPDAERGAVFDGFPRTIGQAEALDRLLEASSNRVNRVVDVAVPRAEIVRRVAGRLTCRRCHKPYHEITRPPTVEGICDRCGGELFRRPDDEPSATRTRLRAYTETTAPLIEYYGRAGVLTKVDGARPREDVTMAIMAALNGVRRRRPDSTSPPA